MDYEILQKQNIYNRKLVTIGRHNNLNTVVLYIILSYSTSGGFFVYRLNYKCDEAEILQEHAYTMCICLI